MDNDQGIDWGSIIDGSKDAFLEIYSTVTQKPIAQRAPNSVMDFVIGTDGASTGGIVRQGTGGLTMILLLGVAVLGIYALTRK